MTPERPPISQRDLGRRIRSLAASLVVPENRVALIVATTAAAQMMPSGVVKGGTAMQLRRGPGGSRFSQRITYGTGRTPWRTVEFELGHDELGCTDDPEIEIAADVTDIFVQIGLPTPAPLPLMARHHQVVQKLHACAAIGNDRARDLVDLQLLLDPDTLNYANTAQLARRLFTARNGHDWAPRVVEQPGWAPIYQEAATDLPVLASLEAAIEWANDLIGRIDRQ